jgi:Ni,Fe-hydrogenase III large subunit
LRRFRWGSSGQGRRVGPLGRGLCLYEEVLVREDCWPLSRGGERGYGDFRFSYGPSAGGLLESVGVDLLTSGELVKELTVDPGFKEREVKVKGKSLEDALLLVERINVPFSFSHSLAFSTAVEEAVDLEPPRGLKFSRIVALELERIRNHLFVIARLTEAASLGVPSYHLYYLVEEVNRVIDARCGHRYFVGSGGPLKMECNFADLRLGKVEEEFKEIFSGLQETRIFVDRLQDNGRLIETEWVTGPAARASGLKLDARKEWDSLPYSDLGFQVQVGEEGDALGRFIVRGEEVLESLRLISSASREAQGGSGEVPSSGEGEGLGRVESPSGDLAYYLRLNRGSVEEVALLPPSLLNLISFSLSMRGNVFTDFQFNWESFGIWISEVGVKFA